MLDLDFINEFGGLVNTTKTYKKEPLSIEQIFQQTIKNQRDKPIGKDGSWFKENKVTPKVGVYKLYDDGDSSDCGFILNKDGSTITETQKINFLDKTEDGFNNGIFEKRLESVRIKHQQMLDKRETNKKSKS